MILENELSSIQQIFDQYSSVLDFIVGELLIVDRKQILESI